MKSAADSVDSALCFQILSLSAGVDRDLFAGFADPLKGHHPVNLGKQGTVVAHADIPTGPDRRSTLPDYDRSGRDRLATVDFGTSSLTV